MDRSRKELLQSPYFIFGLFLLLLNDFVLKYEFSNWATGKISDFAGLFIFPFFFASLFPKWIKTIYLLSAVTFVYWNSKLSSGLIYLFGDFGIIFSRTIDPTDFIAFSILPFSYYYFKKQSVKKIRLRKASVVFISITAFFSFVATSQPRVLVNFDLKSEKSYDLNLSKNDFFNRVNPYHSVSDDMNINLKDSLFYVYYSVPDNNTEMTALISLTKVKGNKSKISLINIEEAHVLKPFKENVDTVIENLDKTDTQVHIKYFEKYFISVLINSSNPSFLYFDNKKLYKK